MSAHDSTLPGEEKPRHMRWDETGGSLSWKGWRALAIAIVAVLGGSGGFVGFQFVTQVELESTVQASEQRTDAKIEQVKTDVSTQVSGITTKIVTLEGKVDDVKDYQVEQDARQEARRITEEIPGREQREREYDRIRELNEQRLKNGKEPCATRTCAN